MYFSSKKGGKKIITKAVDDISFKIYEGETFGLVGESGCEKTTPGRTIIRLYDQTAGEVYFRDRLISGKMNSELRKYLTNNIGMIFQDPIVSLNSRITVGEIVGEGLRVKGITDKKKAMKWYVK